MINFFLLFIGTLLTTGLVEPRRAYSKTIAEFVQEYPQTKLIKCTQDYAFEYKSFPLYQQHSEFRFPSKGFHNDISIIEIPHGVAYINKSGHVFVNDLYIKETQIEINEPFQGREYLEHDDFIHVPKLPARLVILNHFCSYVYGHWIFDILSQLALLELYNIEYDYIWIPYDARFMKETLDIWGLDLSKIVPLYLDKVIAADAIILPTRISNNNTNGQCYPEFLLQYVRDKMLNGIKKYDLTKNFSERVFISRKLSSRAVPNEDEIFALFEPFGFERYELLYLSSQEQIALFNNAKMIVSFVGSGSTNIMFCRPDTLYIEIIQSLVDTTFFYISDIFKLKYHYINDSTQADLLIPNPFSVGRNFPLKLVENYIKTHFKE